MTRMGNVHLGIALIVIGIALTVITHNTGHGMIFYGLIFVGAFRIFRGLADQ